MSIHLMNPERMIAEAVAEVLEPPPPVDYRSWAIDNIEFSDRESPIPGKYNPELFPEFDEILRAASPEDPCRIVTLAKSAQLGGTILANIFTLGSLHMDPCDFLYTHPTDDNGRRWSKLKLKPMLRGTAALAALFPERSRDGGDSVMFKERADGRGSIQVSGANSPASLSQVSMRRQVQDDLSKWEMNSAGDPERQADSRSRAFEFAKILKISTPLVLPGCRISRSLLAGSQEYPEVPCPHCDAFQVLEWENMRATIEANPEDPHFTCIECGCEIREHHRAEIKKRLRWSVRNPKVRGHHRSFWIWSAYSVLQSFARIAQEWLAAKGDPAAEQTFMNDTCGLAYEAAGETVAWETLRDRAAESHYKAGQIPAGALLITLGIDCQDDRVEWQLVGWGRDLRRWVIAYGVIPKHISDEECRAKLDDLLQQRWLNTVGRRIGIDLAAIDGNAWTEEVWAWAKRHPATRAIMVRGVGSETAPLFARVKRERNRQGKLLKYSRRFYNFATSVLKMALYRNLAKADPLERGFVGMPEGLDDDYFRQLTSERRKPKRNRQGFTVYQWVKDAAQANEGLDTHLQAEAAAIRLGIRTLPDATWSRLEEERETPPEDLQLDLEDLMNRPATVEDPPRPSRAEVAQRVRDLTAAATQAAPPDANPVRTSEAPKARPTLAEIAARMNRR
ncbi:terminase gpA endonuclease subunit [Brevundimonas sp.]|uniref:phage terminase large subunit family protein n=1 Tax=Brevundimonas sp. TaxID=1871086 RepID=UPI00286B4F9B|nr:terminase gpA endonuclease subunit [Brevundimonas sp.]